MCILLNGADLLAKTGEKKREFSTFSAPFPTRKAAMILEETLPEDGVDGKLA